MMVVILACLAVVALAVYSEIKTRRAQKQAAEAWDKHVAEVSAILEPLFARVAGMDPAFLGKISLAPLTAEDVIPLQDIYASLEGSQVPHGFSEEYTLSLVDPKGLYFVCKAAGKVVGAAGVRQSTAGSTPGYSFNFATVEPLLQRRGLGSLLFLARLASLPLENPSIYLHMSALPPSIAFYGKLGFKKLEAEGLEYPLLGQLMSPAHVAAARKCLAGLGLASLKMAIAPKLRSGG
jgi:predicted N-acetyltransferase YhbS